MYVYKARVLSAYDGDTIRVDCDLGFGFHKKNMPLRLSRINAPEMRGDTKVQGRAARDFLREKILEQHVTIKTEKDTKGKYGRYLADVFLGPININDLMVEEGHAVYKVY